MSFEGVSVAVRQFLVRVIWGRFRRGAPVRRGAGEGIWTVSVAVTIH